jgi:hypothetical protein
VLGLVRFLLEVGCMGWAAWQKTPRAIRWYVVMQLIGAIVLEAVLAGVFGSVSNGIYTTVYVALSLGVYWTMSQLVKESLKAHPSRIVAFIFAGAITSVVAGAMLGHVFGPFDWLTLVDAAVLVFMGACVGMGAATQSRMWQKTSLVLMAFWFTQALFEMGITLHHWSASWMRTNEWLPAMLTCGGCVWIAYISRLPGRKVEA